ncbi:MAG: DUF5686 and carboxypeptidase regulatory-like domain-containing protein [Dysgonamonadaceae bacterium]|jgi:hypothetical protein|nr:DUF5686 and carboxypeptidase regulatory-like domain-containing protein [Dysgonamonadaceae bacterium]
MKYFTIIFTSCLLSLPAISQTLNGRVTDEAGHPASAASIYISEQNRGLIANDNGEFQVRLPDGEYHLEIRCLGYETANRTVRIDGETKELTVQLKQKDFILKELTVQAGEDPAYAMMRNAIRKAPYYQSVLKESVYEAYVKGSGKMTHIPELINKMAKGEMDMYKDKLFMQESFSEFQFIAPDSLRQKVIAYSSTFPNMNNPQSALAVGMTSLYFPMFGTAVSPFNPKAFDYYRFRYEGYDEENGQIINKIRIIPKLKDPKLLEGVIYLADDEWSVRNAELTLHTNVATIHYTLNYHWVAGDVYLLSGYEAKIHFNVMGLKLDAGFLSSLQYKDIQLNDSLMASQQKQQAAAKRKAKKSLEIKSDSRILRTSDSLALKRDSAWWAAVRTVTLNEEEIGSYQRKDTIQAYTDSLERAEDYRPFKAMDLLMGGSLGNDSSFLRFRYGGLLGALKEYNFVDGYYLGQSFTLDFRKKRNTGFLVSPSFYWATARRSLLWKTDVIVDYAPRRLGQLMLSAGHVSEDFSGPAGTSRLVHSLFTFFGGYSYIKFYDRIYGQLSNRIDVANGLQLTVEMELADRQSLDSHTNWYLFGKKEPWESNLPHDAYLPDGEYSRLAQYSAHLEYTPEYYYRIRDGKKRYIRSRFPTFELDYRQGVRFPSGGDYSLFRQLEASATQDVKLGLFSRLNYTLIAGKFLNDNAFNYIDYKHFNLSGYVTVKSWNTTYALLPYYRYSTSDYWLQAFVNYNTDYLLLKRLPFLQGKMFTETLQAKFLHTKEKPAYSEWGYSVDLGLGVGSLGLFAAFDEWKYAGLGVRLSIPLLGKRDGTREITVAF